MMQFDEWITDNASDVVAEIINQLVDIDYDYYTIDSLDSLTFQVNYASLAYIVQGRQLKEIAHKKIYKKKWSSFNAYCSNDVGITSSRAVQLIAASRVAITLIEAGHNKLPQNPSQAFALSKLCGDDLVDAWEKLLEVYHLHELTTAKIKSFLWPPTSNQIKSMVSQIPVNPESLEQLTKLAFKLKVSINDCISLLLQNYKYYLQLSLVLLKLNFAT